PPPVVALPQVPRIVIKRNYASQPPIDRIIKHRFDHREASRRFVEVDKKRIFAKTVQEQPHAIVPVNPEFDPLQKFYLPYFLGEAKTKKIKFKADWGLQYTTTHTDSKGHVHTQTHITWIPTKGSIKPFNLTLDDNLMQMYAGFRVSPS